MGQLARGKMVVGIALAAAVCAAAGAAFAAGNRKAESPHGRKDAKGCIICHVTPPVEGQAPRRDGNLRFGGDVVALCSSCHQSYRHMHPVNIAVAPDLRSPEDLPLDKDGKITCITCHDAMDEMGVHRKRRIVGRALCLNCHADSEILALVSWYPTRLKKGEQGRLEVKIVDFRIPGKKAYLGESVLLYYYAKNADTGEITFGTNILYDDGSHGDRTARDSIYTLMEESDKAGKRKKILYTVWALDSSGRKSNTVTLAVEYE